MAAYFDGDHHPQKALLPRVGFLAEDDAAIIGYTAGHLTQRFRCQGELQYLFVASQHRRRGVGRALLALLAAWFAEQQAVRVCVNVDDESPAARPFYAHLGATELRPHWMVWHDITLLLRAHS